LSQIAQALKQAFGIQRSAGADRSLNVLKGCRERVLSPCVEVGDELLVQGQAFHANGKQNTTSAMVSTPGHVSFVVQEVTDLVHHHANERFAKIEYGWITLVNNHEHLLIRQILPSRLLALRS
jgi:hypothetical protein